MDRHYCKFCGKKRNEDKMSLVKFKLLKKSFWFCNEHMSTTADILEVKNNLEQDIFIELFSGSGLVAELAEQKGFKSITIDNNEKLNPDIVIDVLNLRRSILPENVSVVWASIPCTAFSKLNLVNNFNKVILGDRRYYYHPISEKAKQAIKILDKTLELILKLNPTYFFIENPVGALRHMPQMRMIPYRHSVSYADYGFDIYKPTDIFTNCPYWIPSQPLKTAVGRSFDVHIKDLPNNYERSKIPPKLINEILESIGFLVN